MKLGIIMVGYQCENINSVLAPWFSARFGLEGFTKPVEGVEFYFAATTALFKERADMGETYSNDQTESYLTLAYESKSIDYLNIIEEPILDYQSRVAAWDSLKHLDLDFVWQLDLYDEYYSYDEIKRTCEWLKENNLYDFYRINFKNYFGKEGSASYVSDFKPVRVLNNRRNGGVKNFYWDNDAEFHNGVKTPNCAGGIIPTRTCNPRHLSWVGSKEFLTKKISYQHKAIGCCSYKWNEEKDCLEFDLGYYNKIGQPPPQIYKDL